MQVLNTRDIQATVTRFAYPTTKPAAIVDQSSTFLHAISVSDFSLKLKAGAV